MNRRSILRIVDANANRALEGLRVCEDILRFHAENLKLFRRCRSSRHAIAAAVRQLPVQPAELVGARASGRDVGRRAPASRLASLERLFVINMQRVKESLRTLEEVGRLFGARHATAFQRLRFRIYELERDALLRLAPVRHH